MDVTLEKIVALCKRRGFIYPTADIYGGLNGVYDTGHLGTLIKENIRAQWRRSVQLPKYQTLFMEGSLLAPEDVWRASGHIANFSDPMTDCLSCKKRFRTDEIQHNKCPSCGNSTFTDTRQFNLMFKTELGATADNASVAYLRPETAQAIFVNFKNIYATNRVKIPFGIAQIGKAFRNEITPKQFLFRMREFEQMELEWFCHANDAKDFFQQWLDQRWSFYKSIGITTDKLRLRAHETDELSHYSSQTTDVEYQFPFGWKELEGIANRGSFDLTAHSKAAGKDLGIFDEALKESYTPHVIECSVGVDRLFLTILFDAYHEDVIEDDIRIVLKLHPRIAPIKAAVLPLVKKLESGANSLQQLLQKTEYTVVYDESGSIGKRYRRYDEIGVPLCFTYDFDSENDHCVTVRDRDTLLQERMNINRVVDYVQQYIHQ
jgi:glycyl-tRNA synthetase